MTSDSKGAGTASGEDPERRIIPVFSSEPPFAPNCKIPPVRIQIMHGEGCVFTEDLIEKIMESVPDAKMTTEIGEKGSFEMLVNEKIVYSKSHLRHFPDPGEMVEIVKWSSRGKSFMHMYLCSFADGGEPNMVVADRRNTPLAKRIILACVIS